MADRQESSSKRPWRPRRRAAEAGERAEHLGRHAEHIDAHLGRVAQLLGPGSPAGPAAGISPAGAELDNEEEDEDG